MAIVTNLTQRLGIEHPILLAPMGFVAGGALAAAVSAAGGFGMIGGGYADPDWLEREFTAAGACRVGCGFITWALAERPAALDVALQHQPAAIMLSFGDAAPFLPTIKRAGVLAICQVQSLAQCGLTGFVDSCPLLVIVEREISSNSARPPRRGGRAPVASGCLPPCTTSARTV